MGGKLNVAVGQCPAELVGPQARYDWLKKTLANIKEQRLDLLILPELFLTGYNVGERLIEWAETQDGTFAGRIAKLAEQNRIAIHYGFAERDGSQLYNTSLCIDGDGKCIGKHQKLLFPPGFESQYFTPGNRCTLFSIGSFNIATLICYDAEFPEACRHVVAMGANLIIMPSVLSEKWGVVSEKMAPTRAFENGVFVCYAGQCGRENGRAYFGGSCIISPGGKELARAGKTETVLFATLNLEEVATARKLLPYHVDRQKLKLPSP